ncbi:unnamed protein product [Hydatigera taeniaeformis]|uniref:Transmembrane BAX inhibitor motif-containing protein 4 n=1 Tax=Hydatigena taeniaeformis TaxID=6205 RepID=A0A0R3X340_HYDTA|nr:unnamed protein product [Hydatigera taeniaeformis]
MNFRNFLVCVLAKQKLGRAVVISIGSLFGEFSSNGMSGFSLGQKLESEFEYNNCVKDADIYIRMGKSTLVLKRKRIPPETVFYPFCSVDPNLHYGSYPTFFQGTFITFLGRKVRYFVILTQYSPFALFSLMVLSFALLISMFYKRYESPINFILLFSFVFVHFDLAIILQAFLITAFLTVGLTLYTLQTKRDFSPWSACLGALLMALLVGGISNMFFASSTIHLGLSICGAFLFACLLIFDTQMIMRRFSAEEYIAASITLYLDILNLFIYVLRVLQAAKND